MTDQPITPGNWNEPNSDPMGDMQRWMDHEREWVNSPEYWAAQRKWAVERNILLAKYFGERP